MEVSLCETVGLSDAGTILLVDKDPGVTVDTDGF